MGVEGLADRHRLRPPLPVADADVVGARVAGDHLVRALGRDVAAALADHDRQLGLVVEQGRDLRHVDVGARPDHAGHLLVEEDRHLGRLHPHLGDVVGVVERDRQVLARRGRRQQAHLGERQPRRSCRRASPGRPDRPRRAPPPVRRARRRRRGRRPRPPRRSPAPAPAGAVTNRQTFIAPGLSLRASSFASCS